MDIRIQLDQEIATYRALLQEEENRWGRLLLFLLNRYLYSLLVLFVCRETKHGLLSLSPLSG